MQGNRKVIHNENFILAFVLPSLVIMQLGANKEPADVFVLYLKLHCLPRLSGWEEKNRDFSLFRDRRTDRKTERNGACQSIWKSAWGLEKRAYKQWKHSARATQKGNLSIVFLFCLYNIRWRVHKGHFSFWTHKYFPF